MFALAYKPYPQIFRTYFTNAFSLDLFGNFSTEIYYKA